MKQTTTALSSAIFNRLSWAIAFMVQSGLTPKLTDRRRERPVSATVALKFSRTVRPPSGAAVRCSALVRRQCAHIFKKLRPTFSGAGSDVQTRHCTSKLYPQNTQNTQKKSASFCVFCGQKNLFAISADAKSPNVPAHRSRANHARIFTDTLPGFGAADLFDFS